MSRRHPTGGADAAVRGVLFAAIALVAGALVATGLALYRPGSKPVRVEAAAR